MTTTQERCHRHIQHHALKLRRWYRDRNSGTKAQRQESRWMIRQALFAIRMWRAYNNSHV